MSRAEIEQRLALVDECIRLDTEHVRRQRQVVDEIERSGLDSGQSKRALAALVESLRGHLAARERLLSELRIAHPTEPRTGSQSRQDN
jgi:hypothetical protein